MQKILDEILIVMLCLFCASSLIAAILGIIHQYSKDYTYETINACVVHYYQDGNPKPVDMISINNKGSVGCPPDADIMQFDVRLYKAKK